MPLNIDSFTTHNPVTSYWVSTWNASALKYRSNVCVIFDCGLSQLYDGLKLDLYSCSQNPDADQYPLLPNPLVSVRINPNIKNHVTN
jgi:hypothetical protein